MSRRGITTAVAALLVVSAATAPTARGHAFAPSLLEVVETASDAYQVRWKQPAVRPTGAALAPRLPAECRATTQPAVSEEGTGVVAAWEVACPGGLRGRTIGVEGIATMRADVLLRLELAGERAIRHVLTADRPTFTVPVEESLADVAAGYGNLGVEHILGGFDHLLFVLGLVLLVGGGKRLLWTITAFTAGHSVTLALATLGLVTVPQAPVEALIAASIYLLAVELASRESRRRAGADVQPSWMERRPGWMAGAFGLLHGLGFAGALTEVGLPAGDVPAALFAFNVGIEAGQIAFVGVVLAGWAALRRLPLPSPRRLAYVPAYAIGTLAAFWVLDRVVAV